MLTDRPSAGGEGVRIAAGRAGVDNGRAPDEAGKPPEARPAPPTTPTTPAATRRPGGADPRAKVLRQRRRRRRVLIAITFLTAVCTFVVGVGYVYVQDRLGQIKRLKLPTLSGDVAGQVMNVLLVGSDSRDNLEGAAALQAGKGQVEGQRSDTIMILHVDPKERKAAIVSVPRDLFVHIAGTNYSDRVNTAFAVGGANQLVDTIQQTLGVTINHYVEMDFVGFKDIVDTVGGVTLYTPYPVRDFKSGLNIPKGGCVALDGTQGLAWVRSRSTEFLVDGTWKQDGRADLGRIERQQDFVRRMMKKALSSGLTNPLQLNRLIGVGVKDVTLDSALSTKDMSALGRRFSSLDPDKVALETLPTEPADIDGKAVLKLLAPQAQPMIDLVNGKPARPATTSGPATTSSAPAPAVRLSDVHLRVLNGVGTPGAASKAANSLTAAGFTVADKGDAAAIELKTTITYGTGQLSKAQALESVLLTPAVVKEDPTLKAVDVAIVVGADYTGVKAAASAPSSLPVPATTSSVPQITPVPVPKGAAAPPPC